jgi:hypothetical protein
MVLMAACAVRAVVDQETFEMKRTHHTIRNAVLAVALTVPAGVSLAASMSEVVTTRENQDVHQQFGRDSIYAIQTRQPADTGSRSSSNSSSGIGEFFAGVGASGAAVWDRMTGMFEPSDSTAAASQPEPEVYGRAGGYVGTDQLALLARAEPAATASEVVTTRESIAANDIADDVRYPAATEDQLYESNRHSRSYPAASDDRLAGASEDAQSAPSPDVGTVEDSELDAMTAAPAEQGEWKQPDEAGAAQEQSFADRQ